MQPTMVGNERSDELRESIHPRELLFATGHLGDRRRAVTTDDAVFSLARHAHRYQDEMHAEQRESFFAALVHLWPASSGTERLQEERAVVAAWLLGVGVPVGDLPALLHLKRDTLRRYGTVRRAEQLLVHREADVPTVPRVYAPGAYDADPTFLAFDMRDDSPRTPGVVNLLEGICQRDPPVYAALVSGVPVDRARELQQTPTVIRPGQPMCSATLEQVQTQLAEANAARALRGPYRLTD